MELEFNSEIGSMSEDLLNELFDPKSQIEGTPSAEDLALGKIKPENADVIPTLENVDDLFDDSSKTPEELEAAKKVLETKQKEEADAKILLEKKEADAKKTPEQLAAEKKEADDKKILEEKIAADEKSAEVTPEIIEALTSTVDYLIKAGNWEDFEGREGLQITPEIYANLVVEQDKLRLNSQFDELVDSTGDYGKAIIHHIKQGGNPDEIIDIFKEQKELESIKTDTEEGKQSVIEKYYKDIMGWGNAKVEKHIKRLITDDEVETEFTDVKELYEKHYKQQLDLVQKEAVAQAKAADERKEQFKINIKTALEKEDTLTPQERKVVEDAILNFKHDIGGGQKVNDFYIKFSEVQKDPAKYIKLVRFIMNPENYDKTIQQKSDAVAAKKTFSFIKGNAAVSKTAGTAVKSTTKGASGSGTNFSFAVNK